MASTHARMRVEKRGKTKETGKTKEIALFLTVVYLRESLISIALEAQGPSLWCRPPTADFSRADGLFEDKRRGRHPVIELIEQAEREWEGKHERASKTLSEAVVEYKRRYKRLPPKGFDDWCVDDLTPLY
ncbi:hypothetical protein PTI98_002188 [Pleurotus ostreatus]|nr:hypothetical protein PTI98_008309 [Pleurotus ostreatus]KAJ8694456.1 hypothetical protein PTI98_009380 [Pleurotus ostreatus]KAJ8699020.1 hypothetical protein PTI98_005659 [Pleurotus ostreatus]KAJ8699026.1 hypothetical protein PTI98_002184 [Pleurotus ostreatus]KAJ8699030.1 hypothetical protein PTI98_002188 [Pleurotus ostreatus]